MAQRATCSGAAVEVGLITVSKAEVKCFSFGKIAAYVVYMNGEVLNTYFNYCF